MGRKKKVFIDKKNSATFQLLARDTSTIHADDVSSVSPPSDRVFVRVDNNLFQMSGSFMEDDDNDDEDDDKNQTGPENYNLKGGEYVDSKFSDAPGEEDDQSCFSQPWTNGCARGQRDRVSCPLPDEIRKEILEFGLPDDGYNYLQHLRKISNAGAGSAYYQNSKAKLDLVPLDVKAYDASKVEVSGNEFKKNSIYTVASKVMGVKVQKVIDADVARLLEDSDLSRFGSDTEELDEDFVFKANLPEGNVGESEEVGKAELVINSEERKLCMANAEEDESLDEDGEDELGDGDKTRIHRFLDEQFDLLTFKEYNDDTYSDEDVFLEMEGKTHAAIHDALNGCNLHDLEVLEQYRVPGDFVNKQEVLSKGNQLDDSMDVIRKCREYAGKYCDENEDSEELILIEESSDESEVWDCETIVSTYSNLDNHPGKIQAPDDRRRKSAKTHVADSIKKFDMIELRGKEKLPMEFLQYRKKDLEKVKKSSRLDKEKSKPRREESKDEKKVRKVAVKEERREARRAKKELKTLYKCETCKAQKVAAVSMPSAIHLV